MIERVNVKKHIRKGKNKASIVRKYSRMSLTHRTKGGKRQVFVDGFWKHNDYPNAPRAGWSYEKLIMEREKLSRDLAEGLHASQTLPARKFGLLTRRIKKIDRLLKHRKHE